MWRCAVQGMDHRLLTGQGTKMTGGLSLLSFPWQDHLLQKFQITALCCSVLEAAESGCCRRYNETLCPCDFKQVRHSVPQLYLQDLGDERLPHDMQPAPAQTSGVPRRNPYFSTWSNMSL